MTYLQAVQELYHELGELRGLEAELAKLKVSSESFQERYNFMVRTELILGLNKIRDKYSQVFIGTAEEEYLNNLLLHYTGEISSPKAELLEKEIDFLNLSTRSSNCLKAENFYHIGQVAQMKEVYLLTLFNVGIKTLTEIKEEMNRKGLSMNMNLGYKVSEDSKLFDIRLDQMDRYTPIWISADLMNFMESKNIKFLGELVQYKTEDFSTLNRNNFEDLKNYLEHRSMSFGMQIPRYTIAK